MAKANLLDTNTANVVELIGNGRIFRVPPYQRDYSWGEEQWEDLWTDVTELVQKPDDKHYLGALVVEAKSDREFEIIDGQQRLATISLLALAIIARLQNLAARDIERDKNQERAQALRSIFLGQKDPASLIEASKLYLNENNNSFYQDYLIQLKSPLNPRGLEKSNKLLWTCFEYFSKQLSQLEFCEDGERLATLLSETIGRQLMFIRISVDDELNAYTVFETLNARGLELTSTDLLKNYMFSRISVKTDRDVLHRRWQSLIAKVTAPSFPEFLRYHLLTKYPKVRTQRLFKIFREQIKEPQDVFKLLDELEPRAEIYAALKDPTHGYWQETPSARPYILDFKLFRVRQMTPTLFAAWEKYSIEEFVKLLKLISIISFRYNVISDLNTNTLEPIYHEGAKNILDGSSTRASDSARDLRRIYVGDDKFKSDFSSFSVSGSGQSKKLVRYILAKLESHVSGIPRDPETDSGSIEHILPENPSQDWTIMFPEELWEQSIYRVGNLTLLEVNKNRDIGNKPYGEKVLVYPTSQYRLTQKVAEYAPEDWTPARLNARQISMANRALQIWRSDYA
ncbi:DUF262 domain-containing HNH endonuclease family protein [Qipengyuania sp. DY56-A-20]|uniref:DUF262 domain-containing HNH endonuclease family protein n=1 Tax=Qipengyuania benthica TaxID=3067651 RepID=A0ABT9H9K5_9SPHN|nr:DUF262 domain-containing HNH endonuclease family protein [Qipengyuania sp. DY56-A-20]MDP4539694.1 DUF262 domain-containing HNH endonuclease family protein [Qipengyuania sp. DY56-A-20]